MRAQREAGSAYLIVLLVLVVLTIVGLSLVLITQTEMQIGANERITNRVFYAADSGVGVATARVLVTSDHTPMTFVLRDSTDDDPDAASLGGLEVGERVEQSHFYPILDVVCNLCMVNQGNEFMEINHAVTLRSTRVAWEPGDEPDDSSTVLAQKSVTVMIEFQPWQPTSESYAALLDEEGLEKIKF